MCKKLIYLVLVLSLAGVASADLIGHWKLDEGSGTIASDSSGNGNDGTINGGPQWVEGKIGGALDFDGTDDYVTTGTSLLSDRTEFTLSCWVNSENYASDNVGLMGQNDCIEYGIRNGEVRAWAAEIGTIRYTWPYTFPSWHHVVLTANVASGRFIYVDGQEVAGPGTVPTKNSFVNQEGRDRYLFNIGGGGIWGASGNWFQGQIDDVRIYNRALSGAEAAWLGGVTKPFDKPF
jgi:hypothetical protein